jgi:hypothetical protein
VNCHEPPVELLKTGCQIAGGARLVEARIRLVVPVAEETVSVKVAPALRVVLKITGGVDCTVSVTTLLVTLP